VSGRSPDFAYRRAPIYPAKVLSRCSMVSGDAVPATRGRGTYALPPPRPHTRLSYPVGVGNVTGDSERSPPDVRRSTRRHTHTSTLQDTNGRAIRGSSGARIIARQPSPKNRRCLPARKKPTRI